MLNFSKSKYRAFWQCPKLAWLAKYKPELAEPDPAADKRMATGTEVGELARGLFGDYVDVTAHKEDGGLDLPAMLRRTQEEMAKGTPVICEAAFNFDGLYCAVDILKREGNGWAIYEVKSSSGDPDSDKDIKDVNLADVAYQRYVLERCGVRVTGVYLVMLNKTYVRQGELDLARLFHAYGVEDLIRDEYDQVEGNLARAEQVLASPDEPDISITEDCFGCPFWHHCVGDLPTPSVFDLYRLPQTEKVNYYRQGIVSFEDLLRQPRKFNDTQRRQMEYAVEDKGDYIDKEGIRAFLDTLSYPLYFLDFETMQAAIPQFDGARPYQQIPFQYSLHYIEREGGELKHTDFLGISGQDPRRGIAEALCRDIPRDVCVTAYNKGFECGRIRELATLFPDLADHLLNIEGNIKDFLDPFRSGFYYNRAMGGSFSIKSVLPALYPDDPALDYHALPGVHNGGEAMGIFPRIKDLPPEEQEKAYHGLLEYCKLDTLAMVKVWEKLKEAAK